MHQVSYLRTQNQSFSAKNHSFGRSQRVWKTKVSENQSFPRIVSKTPDLSSGQVYISFACLLLACFVVSAIVTANKQVMCE